MHETTSSLQIDPAFSDGPHFKTEENRYNLGSSAPEKFKSIQCVKKDCVDWKGQS